MKKWDVELSYGIGFSVTGISAETREEAIKKARSLVEDETMIISTRTVDEGDLEFESVSYCAESQSNLII